MKEEFLAGLVAGFVFFGVLPGTCAGDTLADEDFEDGPSVVVSGGVWTGAGGYGDYGFGNYFQWSEGGTITLDLDDIEDHVILDIEFDLAIIDSWDGDDEPWGPDYFNITLDDETIFQETFSNSSSVSQSYSGSPFVSGSHIYYNIHWADSAYHISLTGLTHSSSELSIGWFASGDGWQGGSDESFAIDNIRVSCRQESVPVPEPATMLLLASGLAGMAAAGIRLQR